MAETYISRSHELKLKNFLSKDKIHKVAIFYGARRIGKTTLIKHFLKTEKIKHFFVNADDITAQSVLSSQSTEKLVNFVGSHKLIFIDEAQRIENIGVSLKILVDSLEDIRIIVTGSSTLDLGKRIGEPLGGRAKIYKVYPFAQIELTPYENALETNANLEKRLIYGSYPEVALSNDQRLSEEYLQDTIENYLLKDLLEFDGIRNSSKIQQLLRLIAFQIGKEVSSTELASNLSIDKKTVERYLDLLEKAFVIFSRDGFSRNKRSEITKFRHYYFLDNGIRNALINNFNGLEFRDDIGMLWENYIVVERLKRHELLSGRKPLSYFWRTYEQQEIDLVEDIDAKLSAFEIKYSKTKVKCPSSWAESYPGSSFELINRDNYLSFII